MNEEEIVYDDKEEDRNQDDNRREGRYYLGNGLWTHPETGGDFYFEDNWKNR